MNKLKITAKVADSYASLLKKGDKVKVNIPDLNTEFETVISYVALNVTLSSRTFEIEIKVPSTVKNLKPNLIAKISVNDANIKEAIVIPLNAIQKSANGDNVVMLAVKQNNKTVAVNRLIKLGMSYLDKIVVTEGLSKDDQIIIEGNEDLIEGQELNIN
jgi:multidrug efflux pump subunit AcrA (membrane-fusion protein)